jgi:hypothetical protein
MEPEMELEPRLLKKERLEPKGWSTFNNWFQSGLAKARPELGLIFQNWNWNSCGVELDPELNPSSIYTLELFYLIF